MGNAIVGPVGNRARTIRRERLRQKVHRDGGPLALEALTEEEFIEVNTDGRISRRSPRGRPVAAAGRVLSVFCREPPRRGRGAEASMFDEPGNHEIAGNRW